MAKKELSMRQIVALISSFMGQRNILTIQRELIRLLKDVERSQRLEAGKGADDIAANLEGALILSQLIFWTPKSRDPEGWIYKTVADWQAATEMSKSQVRTAVESIKAVGVETRMRGVRHPDTQQVIGKAQLHYRIDWEVFYPLLQSAIDTRDAAQPMLLELPPEANQTGGAGRKGKAGADTKPKALKPAQDAAKLNDPVEILRGFMGRYPNRETHEVIRKAITNAERWRRTLEGATEAGHYLGNVSFMLKLYKSGEMLPPAERASNAPGSGRRTADQIAQQTQESMADWYAEWGDDQQQAA
jgi:hypothetical protein